MANCNKQFIDFDSVIILNDSRVKSLKKSRKSLRDRIRDDFKENHAEEIKPKFWGQGSFKTGTAVNPIPREIKNDGEIVKVYHYDVDDGIYFIGKESEKKDVQTYHKWIVDAVKGHTDQEPDDRNTCVRTVFSDGHHIDQPIYFEVEGEVPELAHKAKDWIDSDPREFTEWFEGLAKAKPQLKRLVRYLKAWCDYQNFRSSSKKMPSGLVMTIWAAENAVFDERDDIALKGTLAEIESVIDSQVTLSCLRPTVPENENLLIDYKYEDFFREKLSEFLESAEQAINETNYRRSCGKWQLHFGDRFSCSTAKDEDESAEKFASPAIITSNAKSANDDRC